MMWHAAGDAYTTCKSAWPGPGEAGVQNPKPPT